MDEFILYDPNVSGIIARLETSMRASFQDALERAGHYRQRIAAILEREGLPTDLSYLPLLESGYRTEAVSPTGAVGLWQFLRRTARYYGLRVDPYVDERCDPIRSTRAAARYLRDLQAQFGSWHLSLAAYNLGPARAARLRARLGVQTTAGITERRSLPLEARNYVSHFVAALQIARAPERHGFVRPHQLPVRYDVVRVPGSVSLRDVAAQAGVTPATIAELNPALLRRITPPDRRAYPVRIPRGAAQRFELACARMTGATAVAPPALRLVSGVAASRGDVAAVFAPPQASRRSKLTVIVAPDANAVRRS